MSSQLSSAQKVDQGLPPTVRALMEQYHDHAVRVRGVLEESAKAEAPYLQRFFEYFGAPESPAGLFAVMGPDAIVDCLIRYASQYGPGSCSSMLRTVRMFLRFAYASGYVETDWSALAPALHRPRRGRLAHAIPRECADQLLASIGHDTPADLRDGAILCLLNTYGVRGVQVRRLQRQDVDWEQGRIHFHAVKGGRAVEQPLSATAGNRLAAYLQAGRPAAPYAEMFLTLKEPFRPLAHPRELSKIIGRRLKQAGVKLPEGVAYGSHAFRHAFASRLYGRVPFKDIVDMLGHRDPSTTLRYGQVDRVSLQQAALPWPGVVA